MRLDFQKELKVVTEQRGVVGGVAGGNRISG